MLFLRKSTAVDVLIGPFLDDGDGKTPETGLTIDVELSKNGQALANKSDSTAPTHDAAGSIDGYYNCELDATDTNTTGTLKLAAFASGALHVFETFQVIEQDIYDAIFGSSADLITKINAIDTVVDAVKVVTDAISSNGSGLSAVPWNSSWDSEVQSEVNDALVALGLDHLVSASVAGSDVADNSIVAKLVSKESTADWDDYVNTTESLQALRDRGDSAWTTGGGGGASAADIADAVWDEAASGHASSGTFGKYVADILTDTAVIGSAGAGLSAIPWNSAWDAEVQSECADALTAHWGATLTESYANDNAAATPAQLLYMIYSACSQFTVSGTDLNCYGLDGSTVKMKFTLDDATSPTERKRASSP
tara:strand:- start:7841 stop:8938 length:1098 start_codon:yes stop_codon:yes gene_type:complete